MKKLKDRLASVERMVHALIEDRKSIVERNDTTEKNLEKERTKTLLKEGEFIRLREADEDRVTHKTEETMRNLKEIECEIIRLRNAAEKLRKVIERKLKN